MSDDTIAKYYGDLRNMLTLGKLLTNIGFNYRRSDEPIKTLWQADKDFIHL